MEFYFYKKFPTDEIWFVRHGLTGVILFSFDKKKIYNYWKDYPNKLTAEQKKIFDKENECLAREN